MIVVGGLTTHIDHAVNRRAAAKKPSTRVVQRPSIQPWLRLSPKTPVHERVAHAIKITHRDMHPKVIAVAASFEKSNLVARVSAQAIREHTSG